MASQPPPGQHPAYLHALTDLRWARAFLERPANVVVKWDERRAIQEIDAAIREIKEAAIDDGKNISEHEPVDRPTWGGRLQRALELLGKARGDISEEEDSPSGRVHQLRIRSLEHIANADRLVRDGIEDARALHEPPPPTVVVQPAPPPRAVVVQSAPPPPSRHPAYLHALTDLRAARAFLEHPANVVVKWDEKRAVHEIDEAMRRIKEAAIDDGKDIADHEPVDRPTWGGRLQRSLELLAKARADIAEEEDSPSSAVHQLRGHAFEHIGNAERFVKEGIEDARTMTEPPPPPVGDRPGAHPAYLHALSDLRMARALLERPTRGAEVKWDENRAVGQIDAAIREIRDASIDDGKPLSDHPPIDLKGHHRDRIRTAVDLLDKSAKDIEEREDNAFAKGMRGRAVGHIREAIRFTREALEDRRH
jgi:hypothetical protein